MRRASTLRSAFFAQRVLPRATPLVSQRSFQTLSSISAPSATLSKVPRNLPSPFLAKRLFAARVINTPQFADSITEGELAKWEVEVGSKVKRDQLVAVVETDKVDIEINAPESGTIEELFANQGDTIQTGSKLYSLMPGEVSESDASKKEEPKAKEAPKAKEEPKAKEDSKAKEEPKAKEAPKEESKSKDAPKSTPPPPPSPSSASDPSPGEETKVKMSRLRLRIAERLKESQNTAASLTTFNEVDLRALTDMREKYKEEFQKKHGVKFGFMSAFLKAASIALQDVPEVNARIEGENIVYHNYVDISVAVATPKGLVTPVLRGVEAMSYAGIEKELGALGQKAKEGKITIEDMAGGTFTVSNGGVFGSLMGTPIINMPQSAILGMHGIKERPVAVGGEVKIRPMMYIALTYDHRLIDGREAVTFLVRVKQLVEDPSRLLLGL